jgi:protocatechuate 3,4-dioxygenase beta subunit
MNLDTISRRARGLKVGLAAIVLGATLAYAPGLPSSAVSVAAAQSQPATGCSGTVTPSLTEGPYWKAGSPERTSLIEQGTTGTRLLLTGYVYDKNCNPLPGAWLDFWQTDGAGAYDNSGYKMRGHQFTDASGAYRLETVVPGEYPGRTVHIHVKVRYENNPTLTSQLFVPGVARNNSDSIYNRALLMNVQDGTNGKTGTFNFVLNVTGPAAPQPPATPATGRSYPFKETGFTVAGDFWKMWQGGRAYADSLYINGLPITSERNEVSPTDGKTYRTQWFERARYEYHPENQAPNNVLLGLLGSASVQSRQNETPFKRVSNPGGTTTWFSQTGHTVGDSSTGGKAIAAFWAASGGVAQFGLPLSQPFNEVSKDDGKTYLVQYFERQRLEYHPENSGTKFEVLLGRLGAEQVK